MIYEIMRNGETIDQADNLTTLKIMLDWLIEYHGFKWFSDVKVKTKRAREGARL